MRARFYIAVGYQILVNPLFSDPIASFQIATKFSSFLIMGKMTSGSDGHVRTCGLNTSLAEFGGL